MQGKIVVGRVGLLVGLLVLKLGSYHFHTGGVIRSGSRVVSMGGVRAPCFYCMQHCSSINAVEFVGQVDLK